jgi:hypothetical protein
MLQGGQGFLQRLALVEDDRGVFIGGRDGVGGLIGQSVGMKAGWDPRRNRRGPSVADLFSTTSVLSHLLHVIAYVAYAITPCPGQMRTGEVIAKFQVFGYGQEASSRDENGFGTDVTDR